MGVIVLLVGVLRRGLRVTPCHGAQRRGSPGGHLTTHAQAPVGLRKLLFVGIGQTDYFDVIVREGWEEVTEAGVSALKHLGSWQVADLHQLRPEAAAWAIFRKCNRLRLCVRQVGCPVIDVEPWDELVGSLSRNLRKTARRAVMRVEADGVRRQAAEPSDAERAARRLVTLHREA